MTSLAKEAFDRLASPGARLPWLEEWLLGEVWTTKRYARLESETYLEHGERAVNELEEVIAAAAPRIYDELTSDPAPERNPLTFLEAHRPSAAVVLDGLSLREVPEILRLAETSGFRVQETGIATAATPSETLDFIEQRLGVGRIAPAQLPGRQDLRARGIECTYYDHEGRRQKLPDSAPALLLWSAFPDQTYQDSGARFSKHFAEIHRRLESVWQNTVQAVPAGRRILVTSDHGYVYFGHGCSARRDNTGIRPLTEWFRGERWRVLSSAEEPPDHPDLATLSHRRMTMVRGRVQTHPPGPGSSRLYKHGGLSLMEMLTPWVVLEPGREAP